jgi:hypothetical protein
MEVPHTNACANVCAHTRATRNVTRYCCGSWKRATSSRRAQSKISVAMCTHHVTMPKHARHLILLLLQGFQMAADPGNPRWFECVPVDICAVPELNPCPQASECHVDQVALFVHECVCPRTRKCNYMCMMCKCYRILGATIATLTSRTFSGRGGDVSLRCGARRTRPVLRRGLLCQVLLLPARRRRNVGHGCECVAFMRMGLL